jgi:hypothetical protein
MPERFVPLGFSEVGAARTQLQTEAGVNYVVPAGGVAMIVGMSICNDISTPINVTIEIGNGTNFRRLCFNTAIDVGQALAPVGEMNKIGLGAGQGLYVTSSAAASADATCLILEITP